MTQERIIVEGGHPLAGSVAVRGAKNSVLKLMAASLLAGGTTTLTNVPAISDVEIMAEVLRHLGASVAWGAGGQGNALGGQQGAPGSQQAAGSQQPAASQQPAGGQHDASEAAHTLTIDTTKLTGFEAPYELVTQMRASTAVLGPLIARFGQARVSMPGGCQIGSRDMDLHFAGLEAFGVEFNNSHGFINASVPAAGLRAATVTLEFPSVGATENLLVAACAARGTTTLENVAREPEIVDLANFLNSMGAHIEGAGSPVLVIKGTGSAESFTPASNYRTVGDRIEAGTYLVAGALGGGPVTVSGVDPASLALPLAKLKAFGCTVEVSEAGITVSHEGPLRPVDIQTLPFPGFPTDLQPQFMVLDALANGVSVITENIFENRFIFARELNRMGANIRVEGHHALIEGVKRLSGAPVQASDLRAGAALVLAGLNAEGTSTITEVRHIYRGYQDLTGALKSLGAHIL